MACISCLLRNKYGVTKEELEDLTVPEILKLYKFLIHEDKQKSSTKRD